MWFRRFLLVTIFLSVLYGGLTLLSRQSFFRVQQVVVVGNVHESAGQIVALSQLDEHPPMLSVNSGSISATLRQLRWIDRATVTRQWPHRVTVTVVERRPVAVAPDATGVLQLVDGTGRSLDPAPDGVNLPRLSASGPAAPWPFDRWARPAVVVARSLPPAFSAQVASISVDGRGRITLHFTTPVTFYLGSTERLRAKYVAVASIIAGQTLRPHSYVDVSVPTAVTIEVR